MGMQREFWNDIGRTSKDGGTLPTLLPTPTSPNRESNHADGRWGEWGGSRNNTRHMNPLDAISSVVASPASLFHWRAVAKGNLINAGSGIAFARLFQSSDRDLCWLKTSPDSSAQRMLWDDGGHSLEEFCETWPAWGTMRNGVAYRQPPLERLISDIDYSLLATPTRRDFKSGHASQKTMDNNSRPLSEQIGGTLHPHFVEAILGFPIDWTDLNALETPLSPK